MIGPLAGTFLLDGLDMTYRMIFEVSTFVTAAAIIFSIQLVKRGLPQQSPEFTFSAVRQMAKFPQVIAILIFYASSFGMILTIYPAFLNDRTMSATEIEMLFFVFGVSRVATLASTERLARRTSLTLVASTLCISAGLLISFYSNSIFGFGAAMLLMGFGFSIVFPLTLEIILRQTKKETAGIIIGAYETTFGIGWAVGPVTAGLISEFSGNAMPYLVFFGIGIGVFVFSMIKRKALEPASH
jgi:predicted MFS family arabinose efflux permease